MHDSVENSVRNDRFAENVTPNSFYISALS
jgi:hypothetical protein